MLGQDSSSDRENRVLNRAKTVSLMKRDSVVTRIKSIVELSTRLESDPTLVACFLVASGDLDSLWDDFLVKNQAVLDALLDIGNPEEFSITLESEVRMLYISAVNVAERYRAPPINDHCRTPSANEHYAPSAVDSSNNDNDANGPNGSYKSNVNNRSSGSRLPEIPLPSFNGDILGWPVFRDRFIALVVCRSDLSNVERFYYLLGCLHGEALHAIRSITVSDRNYDLAWSTLVDRFDKPRQLAALIVDKLIATPSQSQESLEGLKEFLTVFSDNVSMLHSLDVPDLGEFLLFSLSMRCLPLTTRKGFESVNNQKFPSLNDIVSYVYNRVSLLETVNVTGGARHVSNHAKSKSSSLYHHADRKSKSTLMVSKANNLTTSKCLFCSGKHISPTCSDFNKLSLDDRYKTARDKRICFRCLDSKHWSAQCKVTKSCDKCTGRHHSLLHRDRDSSSQVSNGPGISLLSSSNQPTVLLGTALIHVQDHAGCMHPVRALIDSASQVSTITASCVERLGLRRLKWTVPLTGLSGVQVPSVTGVVNCLVSPRYNVDHNLSVKAWILPNITGHMPSTCLSPRLKENFAHLALADPYFDSPAPVDMLLGADVFAQIMDGKRVVFNDSLPAAFGSLFGWVIIGPVTDSPTGLYSHLVSLTVSLEDMVQRFWSMEEPESAPPSFTDDGRCEYIYSSERIRDNTGRFSVSLPFKSDIPPGTFSGSKQVALRRFQNLEKKLQADEVLGQAYRDFMLEYESLGHMAVASDSGDYFIPHHPVFKGSPASGKIRVVFDASAMSGSSCSLNQCLFVGPKLQQDIDGILLRFRVFKYVFTTDVCKMYRQILVLPEYRRYQHIFWRPSPVDQLKEYELKTVTYGVNCSPFLALRVLKDIADRECDELPNIQNALRYQTYVDDICVGADSVPELLKLQSDLKRILYRAGFDLKKWSSNSSEVQLAVAPEDRAAHAVNFDDKESGLVKVLGLQWQSNRDMFGFHVHLSSKTTTKRSVLSTIAQIFDPLVFIAPVIFHAKHIMQLIWKTKVSWDESLPLELATRWQTFIDDLPALSNVRIPRHMSVTVRAHVQLCGFGDASDKGYAAVVYLRTRLVDNSVSVSLLGTKTKMAPMKTSTTPRLELCAALLLARWMSRIKDALEGNILVDDVLAWSDSQVVLSWIVKPHTTFKVFVSNRVHQIQQCLPFCTWRYVRSDSNPADCASRGLLPSELLHHTLYWSGPTFLTHPEDNWQGPLSHLLPEEELPEMKIVSLATQIDTEVEWLTRFSSYTNMIRVISWMRRFIGRCRSQVYPAPFLSRSELDDTLAVAVRVSQRCTLVSLYKDLAHQRIPARVFASLRPFIDSNGLIRVGGRLGHSELTSSQRQPLLLAKGSHLSLLIVRHWHLQTCHSGPRVITSLITRHFWVMSVRSVIRKTIGSCARCVRAIARTPHPVMADLPAARVQACRPFSRVGVDYAGPLLMRECRLRKSREYKVHIAIFVCMSVKAVHLEIVLDLSSEAFLAAFDRFVARRGLPQDIYSDCGTNFVGASKQLRALVNHPDNRQKISSHSMCSWHFNPPSAPHFGGLWEAAVRSAKKLLVWTMGRHNPTLEELTTLLCRIEAVLNSRPLTPMSSSPLDLDYLTPGHFIIGQPLLAVPDLPIPEDNKRIVSRWKLLRQCHQAFWRRWSNEYLCSLQSRT